METIRRIFGILDAARSYLPVATAKLLVPNVVNLYAGKKGESLSDVAPHLCEIDTCGNVAELLVAPFGKGEFGILFDSTENQLEIQKHLRKFLMVKRPGSRRPIYFRYYDPRVLRAFLPACNEMELNSFFGPISEFHCQSDERDKVISMKLYGGLLKSSTTHWLEFLNAKFPERANVVDLTASVQSLLAESNDFVP